METERISVQLAEIVAPCGKLAKELLLACARGCLCGAGVGFFVFLRLGFPRGLEFSDYISGLFMVAGLKFGSCWVVVLPPQSFPVSGSHVGCLRDPEDPLKRYRLRSRSDKVAIFSRLLS